MWAPPGSEREQKGGELGQVRCAGEKGREGKRGFGLGWKRKREREMFVFLTQAKDTFF